MSKKILIGGGSGLIGSRLTELLLQAGYEVAWMSRREIANAPCPVFLWDVMAGEMDETALQHAQVVINLTGAGIADQPWTAKRKQIIIDSRVKSNQLLKQKIEAGFGPQVQLLLSSAAIGYYGDRGEEWLEETAAPGEEGFLVESCLAWEDSIKAFESLPIRLAYFRIGLVLSTQGGAFPKIELPTKFFVGPYFGNGQQWYSWAHIDDVCRMFTWAIEEETVNGVYNAVAPNPVTNLGFMQSLMQTLERGNLRFPVPVLLLRLILGEMADTVLSSSRVKATKLLDNGFDFQFPNLEEAIRDLYQRKV